MIFYNGNKFECGVLAVLHKGCTGEFMSLRVSFTVWLFCVQTGLIAGCGGDGRSLVFLLVHACFLC